MLKRKMLRELKLYSSQFITIFLMVFIGVMAYSGIEAYMVGMQETGDKFYLENNLQDLNVLGEKFNNNDINNIKNIKNVNDAEGKLTLTATAKENKSLALSFIESNNISKFFIVDGVKFDKNLKGVWLDQFYAESNNINVGDNISFNYDGYTFNEKVLAIINVPDHLYDTKDQSELYANREEFGFCYLSIKEIDGYIKYKTIRDLGITSEEYNSMKLNLKDKRFFNNIMVDVNSKNNVLLVKDDIEEKIDNALGVIKIEDTYSYASYQGEIDEGKTYVGVFSGLFIFIAMLSVVTTMSRIVKKQRIQIGTLKALGFKDKKIIEHYISYSLLVSILGAICGLFGGYFIIGKIFISLEMSFFEVPNGKPIMNISSFVCAILVVISVAIITYLSTRKNLKEEPANILRNEIPKVNNKKINITTKGIFKKLSFSTKWNIRDILRNKFRTITALVGIMGCAMLIVCAFGMLDTMNNFIKIQFEDLYNFKYKLSISADTQKDDIDKLTKKYGNDTSKSYFIEFIDKDNNKISNNIFVNDSNDKVRFIDENNKFIKLDNDSGIYITYKLSELYGYNIGDSIKWHLIGNDKYYESTVVGFNQDPQNQNITITRKYYESLGNEYIPDSIYSNQNFDNINEIKNIELIQSVDRLEENMGIMLNATKTMICLIITVAIILGIVIIYNMGVLSYSEKEYQFATLKVLGFKDKKIKNIFINQNNIITIISLILGLPFGKLLTNLIFKYALEDGFDFKAHINITTYIIASLGTFLVAYIVSKILSKKINNIDMVSSLKGNE